MPPETKWVIEQLIKKLTVWGEIKLNLTFQCHPTQVID